MVKKTTVYSAIFSLGMIILLAWLVIAAAGDEVKMVTPSSGTNYTTITGRIFNVSFVNGSDITQPSNATFYLNISGSWQPIGNTSISNGCDVTSGFSSCSANITNTTLTEGVYSVNATIFNGSSTISIIHIANLSTLFAVDNSPPQVQEANFSGLTSGTNHSDKNGFLKLNVSILDLAIGVNYVFFNITNSSGVQNSTIVATQEGTGNYYSANLNTSHYPDGTYNITVFANDSLNNLNDSAKVFSVIFDNTNPTVSLSCTPNPVTQSSTITCTCSGGDNTAGVNTTAYTANPSTGQTGTFTTTCVVGDRASNTASSTFSYTVEGQGGGGGGSGGGNGGDNSDTITWIETFPLNSAEFDSGHTRRLTEKRRLQVEVENEQHYIGIVNVLADSAEIQVSSTPQTKTFSVGQTEKFEVNGDNYYDFQVTLDSISASSATITVRSLHEQISQSQEDETSSDDNSGSIFGFDSSTSNKVWWIVGIIIALIIIGGIIYFYKKRK